MNYVMPYRLQTHDWFLYRLLQLLQKHQGEGMADTPLEPAQD